ncbi:MAG: guanylate kinase [Clostridiales bacterium]|nr:guanylate kinase [Clostridiales bacterium]MDY3747386.1 guanylate kinase [Lachnospiraceae bacterium]
MNTEKKYFEKIAERGQLIVISGPSGVGKRTVIAEYMKEHPNAMKCTSVTTREPHPNEVDGKDYHFISHLEFERLIRSQQMLEYAYYNRNGYGTLRKAVEDAREAGRNVILSVDVTGAMKVRALCPDATLIFIMPPTWDELEERIKSRNTEHPDVIAERLMIAQEEILCAGQYDYILINDTIENTVRRLGQIIHGNRYSKSSMKKFLESYIESELHSELADEVLSL